MARQYVVDGLLIQESGARQYVVNGFLIQETTSSGTGSTGSLAYTNVNDTLAASGSATVKGSLSTTNANDTLASSGILTVIGSAAVSNVNDSLTASGKLTVVGLLASTNANDVLTASGASGSATGTLTYTNENDVCVGRGRVGSGDSGFSGGFPEVYRSRSERDAHKKKKRIELGIIEEDRLEQVQSEIINDNIELGKIKPKKASLVQSSKDKPIPVRQQERSSRLEQENAELAYLVKLEAARQEEEEIKVILKLLMEM